MKGKPQLADAYVSNSTVCGQFQAIEDKHRPLRLVICSSDADENAMFLRRLAGDAPPDVPCCEVAGSHPPHGVGAFDFAALLSGISADPSQGITVTTVSVDARLAGNAVVHDQAILLVDARDGVVAQTRTHSYLLSRLGFRHILVVVGQMERVGYSRHAFEQIVSDYSVFSDLAGISDVQFIPASVTLGDNLESRSDNMPWFGGPPLASYLQARQAQSLPLKTAPFRMPVQLVARSETGSQHFNGMIVSGTVARGDRIRVQPSGRESTIERISCDTGELDRAFAGQSVSVTLTHPLKVDEGEVFSEAESPAAVANQFETTIIWMHETPMLPGRIYLMQVGAEVVPASITDIKHQTNVSTLERTAAKQLDRNAIAECNINLDVPIVFDPYSENRDTGCYMLLDSETRTPVGAGLLNFALRRSQNIHVQPVDVDKKARSGIKRQIPCVLWFTGLSGAGKSTIANSVEKQLHARGYHTYLLDGDNVRHGLNKDLGFTATDRVENIRRIAEVAKLMVDAGLIVATAFISPFRGERQMARSIMEEHEFVEVFVDTPLHVAEQRDVKGLYKKARRGELKNFTGIDSPYEPPEHPEFHMDTTRFSASEAADQVVAYLQHHGYIL